jgi:hypothetical protein
MHRRRPVIVGTGRIQAKSHLACFARADLDAVNRAGEGAVVQTMHDERRVRERVAYGHRDARSGWHADHRSGNLQRLADLPEGLDQRAWSVLAVRPPLADSGFEAEGELAVIENAGGCDVGAGADSLWSCAKREKEDRGDEKCRPPGEQ